MNPIHAAADALERFLITAAVEDGLAPGFQFTILDADGSVERRGGGTDALGQESTPTAQYATYCAIKPLLGLIIGRLIDLGELSLEDRISDLVERSTLQGDATIRDCLTHQAQVTVIDGLAAALVSASDYEAMLLESTFDRLPPRHGAYSEFALWRLLGVAIEDLTNEALDRLAEIHVLAPLGLSSEFSLRPQTEDSDLRVNGALRVPGSYTPLLGERGGWFRWHENPGFGGFQSTFGAARLVQELASSRTGDGLLSEPTATDLLQPAEAHRDELLDRNCSFAASIASDMTLWQIGHAVGPNSIGHLGMMGMTATVLDLDNGRCIAYHLPAYMDADTMSTWLRPTIFNIGFS